MSNLIKPIPDGTRHDWTIEVDGKAVDVKYVVFNNPKFGKLSFGRRPEGTIGWIWHEASGGGQGVVPYAVINNCLHIGLINENRPTLSGFSWNIPRGFINPGETHLESARNEINEEIGNLPELELEKLDGAPSNPNSTFFDTSKNGEGFVFFGLKIPADMLVKRENLLTAWDITCYNPSDVFYEFKDRSIKPISKIGEKIVACLFVPWYYASMVPDTFSGMGTLKLLATKINLVDYL